MSMSRFLSWAAVGALLFGCSTGIQPNFRVASEKLQASALAFGDPCTKFWLEFNLRTWDPTGSGPEYWKAYGQWANSVQPSARKVLEGNMPPSELVPILMDTANRDAVNYIANLQKDIAQKHFMLPQNSGNFQLCFEKFGRRELPGNFMQQSNAWLFWADFLLAAEQLRVVQNNSEGEEFWVALYQAILVGAFNEAYSDKQIPPRITSCQLVPSVTPESIRSYVQGRTTLKQIVLDFSNLMRDSARGRCNISNLPREGKYHG